MNHEIPIDVSGITFIAYVDVPYGADIKDYQIDEVQLDISCTWPFKCGLWDYLNDFTQVAIHAEVFDYLREWASTGARRYED